MINFADRLLVQVKQKDNPTVLGLDPQLSYVPEFIRKEVEQDVDNLMEVAAESLFRFNCGLIDAVADLIPAVKPQLAYYEMYGMAGLRAFRKTCSYAREKGLLVIADAKRGDIGPTAGAYARAYLGRVELDEGMSTQLYEIDALTVNAYLGFDGVEPFLFHSNGGEKGIFCWCAPPIPRRGSAGSDFAGRTSVYEAMGIWSAVGENCSSGSWLFVGGRGGRCHLAAAGRRIAQAAAPHFDSGSGLRRTRCDRSGCCGKL